METKSKGPSGPTKFFAVIGALGALLMLVTLIVPMAANANSCTVSGGGQAFDPLPAQTVIEVSTDCTVQSVEPPAPPPPPEPPTEPPAAGSQSLEFNAQLQYANGLQGPMVDRAEVRIDDPGNPANIGLGDFTVEAWIYAYASNTGSGVSESSSNNFYRGNIFIDRSMHNDSRHDEPGWGASLDNGRVVFHVREQGIKWNLIGNTDIRGRWAFVTLQRRGDEMSIYIDGQLDDRFDGWGALGNADFSMLTPADIYGKPLSDPYLTVGTEKHGFDTEVGYRGLFKELCQSNVAKRDENFAVPTGPQATENCNAGHWLFEDESVIVDLTGNGNDLLVKQAPSGYPRLVTESPFG